MGDARLLQVFEALEKELHRQATRRDPDRMDALLHPEFEEIGRSGRRYTRIEIIDEFRQGAVPAPVIARDFSLSMLDDGLALVTYKTAHVDESGALSRFTSRSSLWVRAESSWRLRFHQGTPTDAFPGSA